MRQSLHGVFDPDVKVPEGRIRDAVLLTPAAKHAHLEDMSFAEPSYGLRDHTYEADCKLEKREAGAKVGALATEGNARSMNSQHLDLMSIVTAMQLACKKDNANENGVLKAFRMCLVRLQAHAKRAGASNGRTT